VSGLLGLFIDGAGFFAFSDNSADGAGANLDGHVVDCGVVGEREGIDCLDLLQGRVPESLRDGYAGEESADGSANFGVTQRARTVYGSIFADDC
jgi:hypothetical protein